MENFTNYEGFTREAAVDKVIDKEKGYVDNPRDLGGETNLGITIYWRDKFKDRWAEFNWDGDMKTLPRSFAIMVYTERFWNTMELDSINELNPLLADALFDAGVNCGVPRVSEWFQRLLNIFNNRQQHYPDIVADGDIGPATLRAVKSYHNVRGDEGIKVLLSSLICFKGYHYVNISERREDNEEFTYGWMRARAFEEMNHYMDLID